MTVHFFNCHQVLFLNRIFSFLFDLEIVESADTKTTDQLAAGKIQADTDTSALNILTGA